MEVALLYALAADWPFFCVSAGLRCLRHVTQFRITSAAAFDPFWT